MNFYNISIRACLLSTHRVLCQIPTRAKNADQRFLHFRMPLEMGENLAPILGRSPSATHTKKFQKTEN